jgi:hypothetical protein
VISRGKDGPFGLLQPALRGESVLVSENLRPGGMKPPHDVLLLRQETSGRYMREEVKGDHLTAEQYQSLLRRSASRRNDAASAPESAGARHRPHQEAAIAPVACVALASPHRASRRECRGPGSTACAHANSAVTRTHAELSAATCERAVQAPRAVEPPAASHSGLLALAERGLFRPSARNLAVRP